MQIKVFCSLPGVQGFTDQNTFHIAVDYIIYRSTPESHSDSVSIDYPVDENPVMTYANVYQHILNTCSQLGWETPTKADIFGFVPVPFYMLVPD